MSKTVHILDDEPDSADVFADYSEVLGYIPKTFTNLLDMQKAHDEGCPDIIVLDLTMPDHDGIETIDWLAASHCNSKVMLVSGFDEHILEMARKLAEVKQLHIIGAFTKPVDLTSFRTAIAA